MSAMKKLVHDEPGIEIVDPERVCSSTSLIHVCSAEGRQYDLGDASVVCLDVSFLRIATAVPALHCLDHPPRFSVWITQEAVVPLLPRNSLLHANIPLVIIRQYWD